MASRMGFSPVLLLASLLALSASLSSVDAGSRLLDQLRTSEFTGFVHLLQLADVIPDIEAALASGKSVTVFCPTDEGLLHRTSPTLLSLLKTEENKNLLRKVLLQHVVTERLSPFHWAGPHPTLEGTPLTLSMDSQAFYAADVAVTQYNALVLSEASVHAIPSLILPASLTASSVSNLAAEARRVLAAKSAPAPENDQTYMNPSGVIRTPTFPPPALGSSPAALASFLPAFMAAAAALVMAF